MALALQAVVSLNPSSFNRGMGNLSQTVSNVTGAMSLAFGGATAEILAMGKAFGPVGVAVGSLKQIISVGVPFEQAMANVASVTGLAADELQRLEESARDVAKETKFTATEAAEALYSLGSAGIDTTDKLINTLKPALLLAGATMSDTVIATETLTATMIAMDIPFKDAIKVADLFAGAIAKSPLNMERLAEGMKFAAPAAAAFGLSLEQTVTELAAFNAAGVRGSEAGTAFRRVMIELAKQSKKGGTEIGNALRKWDAGTEGLTGAVRRLEAAGIDTNTVITEMGKRTGPNLALLMRLGADSIDLLGDSIIRAADVTKMYGIQMNTLGSRWKLFLSQLQETTLILYGALSPILSKIVKQFTVLADKVNKAFIALAKGDISIWDFILKGFKAVGTWITQNAFKILIGGLLAAIGAAPFVFAAKLALMRGVMMSIDWKGAWENIVTGLQEVFAVVIKTGKEWMNTFITTVFGDQQDFAGAWNLLLFGLEQKMSESMRVAGDFLDDLVDLFKEINWLEVWDTVKTAAVMAFQLIFATVKPIVLGILDFIKNIDWWETWANIWFGIGKITRFFVDQVIKLIELIVENWDAIWKKIVEITQRYFKIMWVAFDNFMAGFLGEKKWNAFKGIVVKYVTAIWTFWVGAWKAIKGAYDAVVTAFQNEGPWGVFKLIVAKAMLVIWKLIKLVFKGIAILFDKLMTKLLGDKWTKFKDIVKKVFGAVWGAAKGAFLGIKGAFDKMMNALKDNGVWGAFKSIAESAWNGIKDVAENIWKSIKKIWKAGIDFIADAELWKSVSEVASKVWNGLVDGITKAFLAIKGVVTKIAKFIWNVLKGIGDAFAKLFGGDGGGVEVDGGGGVGGGGGTGNVAIGGSVTIDAESFKGVAQESTLKEILDLMKSMEGVVWA